MGGFAFHPEAKLELDEIWEYIGAENPSAAGRVVEEILDSIRTAVRFPQLGHTRQDLTQRPLRFLPVRDYLIAYAPDEDPLWVVAVIHGRRNPRVIAALLRGRQQ